MSRQSNDLIISSTMNEMTKVILFVEEICDTYHLNETYYGNILVSIEEAVRNAILHGNKNDTRKNVTIASEWIRNGLKFTVEDEGEGFDFDSVPDPLDISGNADKRRGTGIFLIKTLSDQVRYNAKGNAVEIVFNISSIGQETNIKRIKQLKGYFNKQKSLV
ncbi:MAG: ATP-binding protein [Bacteroidetes bacterium]|nr:ATP-binding protein [Bacteroidota bacterium]